MSRVCRLLLFFFLLLNASVFCDEIRVSGQFTVGEGASGPIEPEQESPLFNLPSMKIAREYLRRQAEKEKMQFS